MIRSAILSLSLMLMPQLVSALDLSLPSGAQQLTNRVSLMDSYNLPTGPFAKGTVPARLLEGRMDRQTWRVGASDITTLQLMAPLREQVKAAGFTLLFECWDKTCGGFDFRFNTEIAPAPDMYVDVRNYRFLSAIRGEAEAISLLVSGNRSAAYLQ
ncbi:MAG: OmpA family protein, partial [Rhodobacteraceae bacterium]|nr:OmpA family protein [Paracoccaceae bacterium]